jgi:Cell wall-associated hydrolases (invasion-associated proteins)
MVYKIFSNTKFIICGLILVMAVGIESLASNVKKQVESSPIDAGIPLAGVAISVDMFHMTYGSENVSITRLEDIVFTANGVLEPKSVLEHYENIGVANVSGYLNIRDNPGTNGEIIGKLTRNGGCEIIEELDGWYKIKSGSVRGYVSAEFLITGAEAEKLAVEKATLMAKIDTDGLKVRSEPSIENSKVWTMVYNTEMYEISEQLDDWIKIVLDTTDGYVSSDYVEVLYALPEATKYSVVKDVSTVRSRLVDYSMQFLGNRYVWGGTNPNRGADCSGFVQYVMKHSAGISLSRVSRDQANNGVAIKASQMRPGDLIFYRGGSTINHVAMYIGNGQVIHAFNERAGIKISAYNYRTPYKIVNVVGD